MIFWDDRGMAKRYRPVVRDQPFLLPPDMRDWLPADHPVWLVIRVVEEHLDTSAFHALRRTGGAGTAGYDPDMLVMVLVWAYAHRVTSSRRIEQLCRTDVAFRVICGGNLPDHATIARFRASFPGPAAGLFAQVLGLCARLGMGRLGVVALDGMKIAGSAALGANRAEDALAKLAAQTVARHGADDAAEDVLFGHARGDEVPGQAWSPRHRDQRIAAALAGLEAERLAAEAEAGQTRERYLAGAAAGTPRGGPPPAGTEVELARLNLERVTAARQAQIDDWVQRNAAKIAATGTGLRGWVRQPASDHTRVRAARGRLQRAIARQAAAAQKQKDKDKQWPGPVRNITDPHSRLMPVRGGGFIQGYNTQNVTSSDGLIIATTLTDSPNDVGWLAPMMAAAENAATLITAARPAGGDDHEPGGGDDSHGGSSGVGYGGPIGLFLADAGYCSEENINAPGPDRLIATGKRHTLEKAARGDPAGPGHGGPATQAMTARLQTPDGIAAYRQRSHIAETPHGNIKHNMNFRQLSLRGTPKAAAEWQFAATVHNLFKAITGGHLTPATLDALPGHPAQA
jgi:transposase